jgi:hypothetical protein
MQSKLVVGRFRHPAEAQRLSDRALDAGLCIYPCIYLAQVGCFALGLYELMQPTRYPNLGASAYTLPSRSTPAFASAIVPEAKTRGQVSLQADKARNSDHVTAAADSKRMHPVHPKGHDPMMDHGAQPVFGSYGPRSNYQAWGSYPSWRSYQTPSGPQSRH